MTEPAATTGAPGEGNAGGARIAIMAGEHWSQPGRNLVPSRNLLVLTLAVMVSVACYAKAAHNRYVAMLAEAMGLIEENYVEPVDSRALFEGAMSGMIGSLGDQHSVYIPPRAYMEFQEGLDQEFGGVGIVVEVDPKSKFLTVMSPLVNTPAYEAGIQAGDVILKINGKSTRDMELPDAVEVMRGKPGTPVNLTIRRGEEETLEFRVLRANIPVESVLGDTRKPDGSWNYFLEEHPQIGYIRVTTFGDHTVGELEKALAQLGDHPIEALILDLRDNAGGYLSAAVSVSDMFLDRGRIVSTQGRVGIDREPYEAIATNDLFPNDKPIAVLVNRQTASASEIVAAALQDHGRAAVAGVRSWGKGTVQNVIPMEGGESALKLTTAKYLRPSGKNIHRSQDAPETAEWGVSPNEGLEVAVADETLEKLYRLRRQRDIVLRPGQALPPIASFIPETSSTPEESSDELSAAADPDDPPLEEEGQPETPEPPPVKVEKCSDDPQLQRAIEHLRGKLEKKPLSAEE
jgi:carboxyl-terminal processing protease